MNKPTLAVLFVGLLAAAAVAGTTAKTSGYTCSLTGKHIEQCCCQQQKDGKLYCTLAKKVVDSCCCKPTEK
ncbi:MAG: hypothetical protein M3167_06840 [Acidobacteriota bacterium]|nr:hypothetical protein [Acidobacteriota bacterium]